MDVHCSTCGEPWDVYHLWQDAIFEIGLTALEAEAWRKLPTKKKLSDRYRKEFKAAGWEFGQSVINVIRCPGCPTGTTPDAEKMQIKAAIEELLGNDEDGLAATFEDFGL
jgi:hypothetical protein